ncbi:Glutamate racemase [Trichinella pseudospiralis]
MLKLSKGLLTSLYALPSCTRDIPLQRLLTRLNSETLAIKIKCETSASSITIRSALHKMKEATLLTLLIFCIFHFCIAQISKCRQADGGADIDWVILYKPPGEKRGKILVAAAAAWAAYPQDLHNAAGHSFVL